MGSKLLFEFRCPDGHIEEHFAYSTEKAAMCSCGLESKRIISPVRCKLDPASGDFPGATLKWIKEKEQAAKPKES